MMKGFLGAALCGVGLTALITPVYAQGTSAETTTNGQASAGVADRSAVDPTDVNDVIVVTARRRDEDAQDVPVVINAVTQEQAEKLNIRSLQDVQSLVPGLNLATQSNGTGGNVSLRGVNFDVNASGFNPTVEFYLNDAPITSGIVLQSLFDVGQIEVLRGPQGTLRGRASPSGSITLTTRRPDLYKAGGYASMTGNDIGTINFNGGVGVPIIEGVAAIRVAGLIDENEGDRVRTINGSIDRRDPSTRTKAGRVSAVVQPFDALTLEGSYQRLNRTALGYDQVASFSEVNPAAAPSPVYIDSSDRRAISSTSRLVRQKYDIFTGQAQLALGGQRLVYVFGHNKQKLFGSLTADAANVFPLADVNQTNLTLGKTTSHEVRLQNDERVFGIFDYVIGGLDIKNRADSDITRATPVALPPFLGGGLVTIAQTPIERNARSHEQSLFGNLIAHVGDSLELSGGARYIDFRSSGELIIARAQTIPDPSIKDNHVIYAGSAKYTVSPNLMVYASTGSSYRPAIFAVGDFSAQQSALERSFQSLPPETSKSYEVGFKSNLFDRRVRFNVSAYHQTFKNYPYRSPSGVYFVNYAATPAAGGGVTITPGTGQFNFVAAVPVTVNGVEAEVGFSPVENLDINVIGSYSLGKIKKGTIPCTDLNRDGVPDSSTSAPSLAQLQAVVGANNLSACQVTQRSSFSSPFSATVQSEYRIPVSAAVDGYLRGLYSYYGRSQVDPTNSFDNVRSYGLLNLYTGIRDHDGRWEISLYSKNLLKTDRTLTRSFPNSTNYQVLQPPTFRTTAAVTTNSTYTGVTTTQPREFGLAVRYNFGSR